MKEYVKKFIFCALLIVFAVIVWHIADRINYKMKYKGVLRKSSQMLYR